MRVVSTATWTSGDPVSPSLVAYSRIISSLFSTTANFSLLLFVLLLSQPVSLVTYMLPHEIKHLPRQPAAPRRHPGLSAPSARRLQRTSSPAGGAPRR